MKQKLLFSSLFLVLSMTYAPNARAVTTWYVDGVNGSDTNDCRSSLTACKTIGHAISHAASGDSVRVAAATYPAHLSIAFNLSILGSNARTTIIDGGASGRVVTISNANAIVSLSNLTIRNGFAQLGGGIYNTGRLVISSSLITANHAVGGGGGIYNLGILKISNSNITGNQGTGNIEHFAKGGGVLNNGTLTINNSTISGNSLHFGEGGGILNGAGTTTINRSTMSGNDGFLRGGAIDVTFGTVTINNSTIGGNNASFGHGGAIENLYGAAMINNSTISGNSSPHGVGGIESLYGPVTLQNSIVANNLGNCYGDVPSRGYNLSSDGTCNFHQSGDRNNIDPRLGPLQYNGGPTQTQALLPGSPAIDAGNPSGCTDSQGHLLMTDQRGLPRPDREDTGGCDMGAYEKQSD